MSELKSIYYRLCMSSVFCDVLKRPLFEHFEKFCLTEEKSERIKAYALFVSEIYKQGGSLTELVKRIVFEDENVYVKSRAWSYKIDDSILKAVKNELLALEDFAALTPSDFSNELDVNYLSPFKSEKCDLIALYEHQVENVDKYGYGMFSSYPMFRLSDEKAIEPIKSADKTDMNDFVGYQEERSKVIANTEAFLAGRPAANALLCGDAGTGKSSTVKAIANYFFKKGLRLIELRKDQLSLLPYVMGKISENPLKFIIFIDDLSFNKSDDNFSMLKAALEGSASAKSDNAVIYATSNRRHIVKESFQDREGSDVHINDTIQETLSLSERFGLVVLFKKPNKQLYLDIVHELALRFNVKMPESELDIQAEAFALRRGNRSARCAEQFIKSLL